jgi:[ribosomal protein S5]-alanine N-acetyltransferase
VCCIDAGLALLKGFERFGVSLPYFGEPSVNGETWGCRRRYSSKRNALWDSDWISLQSSAVVGRVSQSGCIVTDSKDMRRRWTLADRLTAVALGPLLHGRRVTLRPLQASDFGSWQEVRRRCASWLVPWEARRGPGQPDIVESKRAFEARCDAADRERMNGSAFRFGIFLGTRFTGEINLGSIQRGAFQNVYVGYWIDEAMAGQGLMPEALVVAMRFAFEDLGLHRVQVSIIPRNGASRRVTEKLGLRNEGIAERYLEINGVWEDHVRYAITAEEWRERRADLLANWIDPVSTRMT